MKNPQGCYKLSAAKFAQQTIEKLIILTAMKQASTGARHTFRPGRKKLLGMADGRCEGVTIGFPPASYRDAS